MSDWEIVQDNNAHQPSSDWEVMPASAIPQPQESFGQSLLKAIPRLQEDIYHRGMNIAKSLPEYYEKAKTEIPGFLNKTQPGSPRDPIQFANHLLSQASLLKQIAAGVPEMGLGLINLPADAANYTTNRLNLFPKDINNIIQKYGRLPDDVAQEKINKIFGTPQAPGEAFGRGLTRNIWNLTSGYGVANLLNPLRLTAKGITKNVINAEKNQVIKHTNLYNNIWNEAEKSGFNKVPFDPKLLEDNHVVLSEFYPRKSLTSLENLLQNPKLEHAQAAQSDLGVMRRALEEKARKGPLLESEKNIHNILEKTEKHIEDNMFKNSEGAINNILKNKYKKVTNSYRENVVPYKYNPAIQAYKNKEMLTNELVNALSRGEFAAKKGSKHPAIKIRNILSPVIKKAGLPGAGLFGINYLYDQMFGDRLPQEGDNK